MQNKYSVSHSCPATEALLWLEKQTNLRTNYPQMLSGPVQGGLLRMLVRTSGAARVLEIGTFTGYSSICMAMGLPEGGHIDTLEINDEFIDLIREAWDRAGVSEKISLYCGDAVEILGGFSDREYDLVFIDADKRQYCQYYSLVLPLVRSGGLIVADDVMMGGKVYAEPPATDPQTRGLSAFNEAVIADDRVEVVMLPMNDGISLIRKK